LLNRCSLRHSSRRRPLKLRHKQKLFQRLTTNVGYPKLREHLGGVVATMKLSNDYHDFIAKLDRLAPRYGETIPLPLDYRREDDDGMGI
jgi:hypothetical protein